MITYNINYYNFINAWKPSDSLCVSCISWSEIFILVFTQTTGKASPPFLPSFHVYYVTSAWRRREVCGEVKRIITVSVLKQYANRPTLAINARSICYWLTRCTYILNSTFAPMCDQLQPESTYYSRLDLTSYPSLHGGPAICTLLSFKKQCNM